MDLSKLSLEDVIAAGVADDDIGFCTACGAEIEGVEPDAGGLDCEWCDASGTVYGSEELLLMML